MGDSITISGSESPDSIAQVKRARRPMVTARALWSDPWATYPELEFIAGGVRAAAQGLESITVRRWYGKGSYPHQAGGAIAVNLPLDLAGWWVRIEVLDELGFTEIFTGRISTRVRGLERRKEYTGDLDKVRKGTQEWRAYGPLRELQKIELSDAWVRHYMRLDDEDTSEYRVERVRWVPGMNKRTEQGVLVGNRSAEKTTEPASEGFASTYVFGDYTGAGVWTHYDFLEYLLERHVTSAGGPTWSIGGPGVPILKVMQSEIEIGQGMSAAEVIGQLIDPRYGLDYTIEPRTDPAEGFELYVFPLVPDYGEHNNPLRLDVDTEDNPHVSAKVWHTADHNYGRLRVEGRRVVVCCSIEGAQRVPDGEQATLVPGWAREVLESGTGQTVAAGGSTVITFSGGPYAYPPGVCIKITAGQGKIAAVDVATFTVENTSDADQLVFDYQVGELEQLYLGGAIGHTEDPEKNDALRQNELLRNVFRLFRAPSTWHHNKGLAAPLIDLAGNVVAVQLEFPETIGPRQNVFRSTLGWVPLFEGVDYAPLVPNDTNPPGWVPDLRKPAVWIFRADDAAGIGGVSANAGRYVLADEIGIGLQVSRTALGVYLKTSPGHRLAAEHADYMSDTQLEPEFDYERLACTLAFECDERLAVEENTLSPDSMGTKVVQVPDAEYWYVAPGTLVGVDADGRMQACGAGEGLVIRNDMDRLRHRMAGVIARYQQERVRAEVTIRGIVPMSHTIGYMLMRVQQDGGDLVEIRSPIIDVQYDTDRQLTVLRTGYQVGGR